MNIDKRLNLVIPLSREDGSRLYVHSTPIRQETFELYHLCMAKTFSAFTHHGLDPMSGPSVAAMVLKGVAMSTPRTADSSWWDGVDGVGGPAGLMSEITRLSNVLTPTAEKGWDIVPLASALEQELMSEEEKSEVMNLLTFFTVVSLTAPRVDRQRLIRGMASIYELQTTFSGCTEFVLSLRISTAEDASGKKPQA